MSWFTRLRNLFQRDRLAHEVEEEPQSQVEMRTRDNVVTGMRRQEDRDGARQRFGNHSMPKERTREMDLFGWIETAAQDLRYAVRMLRRSPGVIRQNSVRL